jgi:hypothetical protein
MDLRTASQDINLAPTDSRRHNEDLRKALSDLESPIHRINDQLSDLTDNLESSPATFSPVVEALLTAF